MTARGDAIFWPRGVDTDERNTVGVLPPERRTGNGEAGVLPFVPREPLSLEPFVLILKGPARDLWVAMVDLRQYNKAERMPTRSSGFST